MNSPKWLFITDPWATLDHPNDTTLRLMEAAACSGIKTYWSDARSIRVQNSHGLVDSYLLNFKNIRSARIKRTSLKNQPTIHQLRLFDQIHYRVDPPVDLHYLHPLQILSQFAGNKVVNPPELLVLRNEKTLASEIPTLFPKTLVSADRFKLKSFIKAEKTVVLKPLHEAQSKGILCLESKHPKKTDLELEKATENFSRPILLQRYLPNVRKKGETRLWFINGRLIACAQKIPKQGEFVIHMDHGGSLQKKSLQLKDRLKIKKIEWLLKKYQIRLAAVDWIDQKITDFNFTSPGLLVAIENLLNKDLASQIVRDLLRTSSPLFSDTIKKSNI